MNFQMLHKDLALSVERDRERKLAKQETLRLAKAARAAAAPADRSVPVQRAGLFPLAALTRLGRSFGRGFSVAARRRVPA
jgi:ribosomal protein L13E